MIFIVISAIALLVLIILLFSLPDNGKKTTRYSYSSSPYLSSSLSSLTTYTVTNNSSQLQNALGDNIKILTYNLNYKGLQDHNNECGGKNSSLYKVSDCKNNIISVINSVKPIDFICLQEAARFSTYKESIIKKDYNYKEWLVKDNRLVTIWNKKKYGSVPKFCMCGILASRHGTSLTEKKYDKGRLYQLFLFEKPYKICLINIHQGHFTGKKNANIIQSNNAPTTTNTVLRNISLDTIKKIIESDIKYPHKTKKIKFGTNASIIGNNVNTLNKTDTIDYFNEIKKNYRIIIAGDFNCNFKKFEIFDKILKNNKFDLKTCCYASSKDDVLEYGYDHILDSYNNYESDESIVDFNWPASDHAPVIATLYPVLPSTN